MSDYDVIIIGTGAGGGTLARHLAPSGKKILLLERGGWLPARAAELDARRTSSWTAGTSRPTRGTTPRARPSSRRSTTTWAGPPSSTAPRCIACARRTSGSSSIHDGISPAWPIDYGDMEPYYTMAEGHYQVRGARARTRPSRPRARPTRSRRSRTSRASSNCPTTSPRPACHPFHAPCGVLRDNDTPQYSVCVRCRVLRRLPVPAARQVRRRGASAFARRSSHPNVTLLTERAGGRLRHEPGRHGRDRVVIERDGSTETVTGDVVVVSCGAANSAKLLLASANDKHPNGLANGSDQVGRNYMFHYSQAVLALSKEPNPTVFQKTLGVNDFYFGDDDFEYPMGNIQMVGKSQAEMYKRREADRDQARADVRARGRRHARRRLLALDRGPAAAGEPRHAGRRTATSSSRTTPSNEESGKRLYHKLKSMLGHLGMHEDHLHPAPRLPEDDDPGGGRRAPGRHLPDRAATRPRRCVDSNCKAHELDNLYVVDTSCFPSIGAVNPALTAMANALARRRPPARAALPVGS